MIILPAPSQDEIDRRFELAVSLHKEHLLSKTGKMYPLDPDNLQEAIAEMSEEQKVTLATYVEMTLCFGCVEYLREISINYWDKCAQEEALFVVQKNFDPSNMR